MKRPSDPVRIWAEQARGWAVDYSAARDRAIRWLGDRYLLARPINGKAHDPRKRTTTL
ncbi:MAG: hypothetical protein ACRETG_10320 [Steroidobacteraceae bacterium]